MDRVKKLVKYHCVHTINSKNAIPLTGKGIGVAILDTGSHAHIDLKGKIYSFQDCVNKRYSTYDESGHGTHVAGIIAGSGAASKGKISGMAPGSQLHILKVLNYRGDGNIQDTLKGIRWILENHKKLNIRIVNISVGTIPTLKDYNEFQLLRSVDELWDAGIIVVTAAGNNGPKRGSITLPGISKKVITVGAVDDHVFINEKGDVKYNYSGRGPTYECVCKPDIVAPGSYIKSCNNYKLSGQGIKKFYTIKSGTSMATPVVSGAIALLLEKDPTLTNVDVKLKLRETSRNLNRPANEQGWGLLDITKLLD